MTPDEILAKVREARAICDAATPGPWEAEEKDRCWQLFAEQRLDGEVVHPWQLVQASKNGYWPEPKDSRFITAARTGWPEALDIIEQLVARVRDLEAMRDRIAERMERDTRTSDWLRDRMCEDASIRVGVEEDGWRAERVQLFSIIGERWTIIIWPADPEADSYHLPLVSHKPTLADLWRALRAARGEVAA